MMPALPGKIQSGVDNDRSVAIPNTFQSRSRAGESTPVLPRPFVRVTGRCFAGRALSLPQYEGAGPAPCIPRQSPLFLSKNLFFRQHKRTLCTTRFSKTPRASVLFPADRVPCGNSVVFHALFGHYRLDPSRHLHPVNPWVTWWWFRQRERLPLSCYAGVGIAWTLIMVVPSRDRFMKS